MNERKKLRKVKAKRKTDDFIFIVFFSKKKRKRIIITLFCDVFFLFFFFNCELSVDHYGLSLIVHIHSFIVFRLLLLLFF